MEYKERCGDGTVAIVYKINWNGQTRAVKKFAKDCDIVATRERRALRAFHHPCVLPLLAAGEEADGNHVFIFPYFKQDLHKYIYEVRPDVARTRFILHKALRGLAHVHEQKWMHLDIKPSNILIDEDDIVIADFSLALQCGQAPFQREYVTDWYRPPELLLMDTTQLRPAVDIWSMGCVFAEMIRHKPLFPESSPVILRIMIEKQLSQLKLAVPTLNEDGLDLLSKMLSIDPTVRITAQDALAHPFFHGIKEQELNTSKFISSIEKQEL
jgi:serine/threonine protein kinase